MISSYLIAFCSLTFAIAITYAFLAIAFNHKFNFLVYAQKLMKEPILMPIIIGLFSLFVFLFLHQFVNTETFKTVINDIAPKNSGKGAIGDFFNGMVAPTVSIISIIYIYKAFRQQYDANQMILRFEIDRTFKDDLDWLKNNSEIIENIESSVNNQSISTLSNYLTSVSGTVEIRKGVFVINVFHKLYLRIEEHSNSHIKNEITELFSSLFLPSLKVISRELHIFIDNQQTFDPNSIEVTLLRNFTLLYEFVKDNDKDTLYIHTHRSIQTLLN